MKCPYCGKSDQVVKDAFYISCIRCKRTIKVNEFWKGAIMDLTKLNDNQFAEHCKSVVRDILNPCLSEAHRRHLKVNIDYSTIHNIEDKEPYDQYKIEIVRQTVL